MVVSRVQSNRILSVALTVEPLPPPPLYEHTHLSFFLDLILNKLHSYITHVLNIFFEHLFI